MAILCWHLGRVGFSLCSSSDSKQMGSPFWVDHRNGLILRVLLYQNPQLWVGQWFWSNVL